MWPNSQFPVEFVTFTKEILDGKLHFLCSVTQIYYQGYWPEKFRKFVNTPVKEEEFVRRRLLVRSSSP